MQVQGSNTQATGNLQKKSGVKKQASPPAPINLSGPQSAPKGPQNISSGLNVHA